MNGPERDALAGGSPSPGPSPSPPAPPPAPSTPGGLRALLRAHGVEPSHALGQHFLADANTARRIVALAGVGADDAVVEIGPGVGALTLALADAARRVVAIEVDRQLVPVLEAVLAARLAGAPVSVVRADALAVDWPTLLAGEARWRLVANLPYNVATPLVLRVLEQAPAVEAMLVMVQREVGERMAAGVGDPAYGAVSVKLAYDARARVAGRVPATVFHPRPHVDSVLVAIDRHPEPAVAVPDRDRLFALVRAGFATRRKTLRNALRAELGARTEAVLAAAGVDPGLRAERLELEAWAAIARAEHAP